MTANGFERHDEASPAGCMCPGCVSERIALRARAARDHSDRAYRDAVRAAVTLGVSRGQLARTLGIDRAAVSRIVSGKRSGSPST